MILAWLKADGSAAACFNLQLSAIRPMFKAILLGLLRGIRNHSYIAIEQLVEAMTGETHTASAAPACMMRDCEKYRCVSFALD
jgi:hypothetical protein